MKTRRIWSFRTLTNRSLLIDCRPEVCSDLGLIGDGGGVSRMRIVLGVMLDVKGVCSLELLIEHSE